ncbi:hypothetical protein EI94DRAFT_1702527 [Lactarius quietus]|nr:hypothetical protein EI94DRAFT_1702527 [Lactarius quietus]
MGLWELLQTIAFGPGWAHVSCPLELPLALDGPMGAAMGAAFFQDGPTGGADENCLWFRMGPWELTKNMAFHPDGPTGAAQASCLFALDGPIKAAKIHYFWSRMVP